MKIEILNIFLVLVTLCLKLVTPKPISVPVDNTYSYNNNYYDDVSSRHPNAHFNRLPQNSNPNQAQVDDVADSSSNNDYDYEDQQTDKPVISSNNQQQSNYNNLYSNNYLLTENRVKFKKKKRRIRRPCIPIQSYGSPLFSNRLRRQTNNDAESGKTLGLLLGGGGYNNYYQQPYYQQQGGFQQGSFQQGGNQDIVKPQYDSQGSGQVQYGQAQYQHYGGYPCIPVSTGHRPGFGGGGLFGGGGGPFGGGGGPFGGGSGPFGGNGLFGGGGLLGQGGLLDFGSPGPLSPAGIYQGSGSYPQTVIINRPPLFGNLPNYNRPQGGGNYPQDSSIGGSSQQPFWGSVVDKLQEFVTGINPQQVFSSFGDSLQGLAQGIQNLSPSPAAAADTIRQGYREFSSLLFR